MVTLAFLVLTALVIGEAFVIFVLMNRLLTQAKLPPITVTLPHVENKPEIVRPQPKFSVPFVG